jgi:hypothetical protein
LAAMLAMVLAAAAPALAQQIGGDQGPVAGDDAVQAGDNVQYSAVCQNIIGSFDVTADQSATATASASGGANAAATAEIDQSQNISGTQTNRSLNGVWWWGGGSSLEPIHFSGRGPVSGDPTPEFMARSPFSWVWAYNRSHQLRLPLLCRPGH